MKKFPWLLVFVLSMQTWPAFSLEKLEPKYSQEEIARFSTHAESSLRQKESSLKAIMGVLYLDELNNAKYEGLSQTFKNRKLDPAFIDSEYTKFEQAFDKLSGLAPYNISNSTRASSQLFLDILIMTGHPKAIAIGNSGKVLKESVFNVYEWFENIPGKAYDRKQEFLRDYRYANANLSSIIAKLVYQSQFKPELRKILEIHIYPKIGFDPESSDARRAQVIPEVFGLANDEKIKKQINKVISQIERIENLIQENEDQSPDAKQSQESSQKIDKELSALQKILPELQNREQELAEQAQIFRATATAISNLSALLSLAGYEDSNGYLRATLNMAMGASKMAQLTSTFLARGMELTSQGKQSFSSVDSFSFSMDVMNVFFDLAVCMTPGMSPESQMMLGMHKMIKQLMEYLEQQFTNVHLRFDNLMSKLDEEFKRQELRFEQTQSSIDGLHSRLAAISVSMNQQTNLILNAMEAGFDELSQKEIKDCLYGYRPWQPCRNQLVDHAINNSGNDLRLFKVDYRTLSYTDIQMQLKRNLFKNAAFLEHIGRNKVDMNSTNRIDDQMINPQVWAVATNQYLDVIEKASQSELTEEKPYIQALLSAYDRFSTPMKAIFARENNLIKYLFSEYLKTYNNYLDELAGETQKYLNLNSLDYISAKDFLNFKEIQAHQNHQLKIEPEDSEEFPEIDPNIPAAEAEKLKTLLREIYAEAETREDNSWLFRSEPFVQELTLPKTTKLMTMPNPKYGGVTDLQFPDGIENVIDKNWIIAERMGLVKLQPYLMMDAWHKQNLCYFGLIFYVESTELDDQQKPLFNGVVKFYGKHFTGFPMPPYKGSYDLGSCLSVWPKVAKNFLMGAQENYFFAAKRSYDWGRKEGGWQLEVNHLAWLWDVWALKKRPNWDENKIANTVVSQNVLKLGGPEHKRRNVSVPFMQHQIFSSSTLWESIDYLETKIKPQIEANLKVSHASLNEFLIKQDQSGSLLPETKSKLLAIGELIKTYLLLGYSDKLQLQTGELKEELEFFAALKYFENPPPCISEACPDYIRFLFQKKPETFLRSKDYLLNDFIVNNPEWQEPQVFSELRRRLTAINQLIDKNNQN